MERVSHVLITKLYSTRNPEKCVRVYRTKIGTTTYFFRWEKNRSIATGNRSIITTCSRFSIVSTKHTRMPRSWGLHWGMTSRCGLSQSQLTRLEASCQNLELLPDNPTTTPCVFPFPFVTGDGF